jgi:hypothetical protein
MVRIPRMVRMRRRTRRRTSLSYAAAMPAAGFALPHGLRLGDFVVVTDAGPARGLGQLDELVDMRGEPFVRVRTGGRSLMLSAEAAARLEKPLSRDDAAALLALASAPAATDERPVDDQHITSTKTVSKGTWTEIAKRLAVLYASPWKLSFGGQRMIAMFESVLVPMIAHAMGRDETELLTELRADKPVFSASKERPVVRPKPPPAAPALEGWNSLFSLELDGEIWIGERPDWHAEKDNGLARLDVTRGRWHSYERVDEEEDEVVDLLLVHESALREVRAAKWRSASEIASVVGSGAVNFVDATALGDEDTMDRVRYLGGTQVYGGRALCVDTNGWDGPLPVLVSPPSGPTTMIRIPLRDDE